MLMLYICGAAKMDTHTYSTCTLMLQLTNINTAVVFSGTLRASYEPSRINKAVTQMEKSWQVKKKQEGKIDLDQEEVHGKDLVLWLILVVSLAETAVNAVHFLLFSWAQDLVTLNWRFDLKQAVCGISMRAIIYSVVYGDLIRCSSSLQTLPEPLIGCLCRKHTI